MSNVADPLFAMQTTVFALAIASCYAKIHFSQPGDAQWPTEADVAYFSSGISGGVVVYGAASYDPLTYNLRTHTPKPAIIVKVQDADDVASSLRFANQHNMRVVVNSTGHHYDVRNTADNAVLIDCSSLNHKYVSDDQSVITVGPGYSFKEILLYLNATTAGQKTLVSGGDNTVGPYGWSIGGGHGFLSRMHGYGADNLVSVDLVLSNGTLITANRTHHLELFRALRGSGGSAYGVAVSLTIRLHDTPPAICSVAAAGIALGNLTRAVQNFMPTAPPYVGLYYLPHYGLSCSEELLYSCQAASVCYGSYYCLANGTISKEGIAKGCDKAVEAGCGSCYLDSPCATYGILATVEISAICSSDPISCESALKPLSDSVGSPPMQCGSYYDSTIGLPGDVGRKGAVYFQSTAMDAAGFQNDSLLKVMGSLWQAGPAMFRLGASIGCSGNAMLGGLASGMDPEGTDTSVAPAMRRSLMAITCYGSWEADNPNANKLVQAMDEWGSEVLSPLGVDRWVYWNEPNHNFNNASDWQQRYWGSADRYSQLLDVKKRYDPTNRMACYQCVGWEDVADEDPAVCPETDCSCSNTPAGGCAPVPSFNQVEASTDGVFLPH